MFGGWIVAGGRLICPAFAESAFPDVNEYDEYAEAVTYVNEAGIMVGDGQGYFHPNKVVTRAEMATIICRMLGETEHLTTEVVFSDVPTNHWANGYINKAAELGVVGGYGNGVFGPSDNVTYEQTVTMIIRALGGSQLAEEEGGYPNGFLTVAEQHGFLQNIRAEQGEPLSRGDVSIILLNCADFSFVD